MQSGGGKNVQKGGYGEMDLKAFTKFVNCGQYRDKSQNTFDCANVNIPDDSGTVPLATATPVDDGNITLEVNEKQYSSDIKMVTVNMFIPNRSKVIVKNYAHNTEEEMTSSLPDSLPASGTRIPSPVGSTSSSSSSGTSSTSPEASSTFPDASTSASPDASGTTPDTSASQDAPQNTQNQCAVCKAKAGEAESNHAVCVRVVIRECKRLFRVFRG